MIDPDQLDPTWEKCARLLLLNPLSKLLIFQKTVQTIFDNIISYPDDDKYITLKTSNASIRSKILEVNGGLEFFMGVGFRSKIDQSDSKVLTLCIERTDDYVVILGRLLSSGRDWLADTISTCNSIVTKTDCPKLAETCADCIINIKLPTGATVCGGFLKEDKLLDVLTYACSYFDKDRVRSVTLISPETRQRLTIDELNMTLAAMGMCPRAVLMATVLSQEDSSNLLAKIANDVKLQGADARSHIKKEKINKKAQRQALQDERNRTLQNFKDDRLDFH